MQANPAACAAVGKPIDEIVGYPVAEVVSHWPVLAEKLTPIEQLEIAALPQVFRGDRQHWYLLTSSNLHNSEGQTAGWVFAIRDITQQYETERKHRQLAAVIEQAQETIVITRLNGNIIYANPYFETTTGYTVQEAIGKNPRILRSGHQDTEFYQQLWEVITSGKTWSGTFINKRKDGSLYYEAAIIFPLKDDAGKTTGYAAIKRDITEQVKAENALRKSVRQQFLLNEIIHAAIQQTEFDKMLQTLAKRMVDLLDADGCYITVWDDENSLVRSGAGVGSLGKEYQNLLPDLLKSRANTQKVLELGRSIFVENIYNLSGTQVDLPPELLAAAPDAPGLVLPLIAHGEKLGAVLLAFASGRQVSSDDIQLGMQAADQIALAMLKNKLLEQAEQRAREAETLRLAGAAVVTSLKQDEAIERILEAMKQVVPYDSGTVLLKKNQTTEMIIVGARGFPSPIVGQSFHLDEKTPNKIVLDTRKPYTIDDVQKHYKAFHYPPYNHIHGWLGIPLIVQNRIIGMLTLDSKKPGRFTPAHARLAEAFAAQVAIALENVRLFEETRRLATTDSLTKIYNRGHFMKLAQQEFERARRYQRPLSLIMFDIDHFKNINDSYGHIVGDKTLQAIVQRCLKNLRTADVIGRYGGEEFVILFPETTLTRQVVNTNNSIATIQPARLVAERLRHTVSSQPFRIESHQFNLTISLGITERHPADKNIEALINRADQALLRAKEQGRNRIVILHAGEQFA